MIAIPFRDETEFWARGRNPWGRGALLLVLFLLFLSYLRDPGHSSIFDGLNLVVHEAGHMFFYWFGELPGMAGGTVFEVSVPLAVAYVFFRQRDFFAMAVALFWFGTALFHVGIYVADARAQLLGLVSVGAGEPMHDWYYLLARAGLLEQDELLGAATRILGTVAMATGLAWGGWMIGLMGKREKAAQDENP